MKCPKVKKIIFETSGEFQVMRNNRPSTAFGANKEHFPVRQAYGTSKTLDRVAEIRTNYGAEPDWLEQAENSIIAASGENSHGRQKV